ncbi:LysR family transcriptional regulator [Peribacillus sp. SCS-37]|uniref:LysR family transcriptional regulator n=1 Tax=Paraperibacillus esterisolvens TaxID=3115296 RepID=UPI0039060C58
MEFKWLKTFITAADLENFRQTAEELFISQPTVSVHIKLLEETLDVLLFERIGRRVLLTEAGRRFLPHAVAAAGSYKGGLEDLHRLKQGLAKKLTLAISPLIASSIMPVILHRYMELNQDLELEVQVLDSKDIGSAVLSGKADLGLSRMNILHPELIVSQLYEDKLLLCAPRDGRDIESGPPLDAAEILSTKRLIIHNHPEYWEGLLKELKQHLPLQTMVVSEVHVTKRFIEEGLGVSFLPVSTVRRELLEGRLLEIDFPLFPLPAARTYTVMKYQHSIQLDFLSFLKKFRLP